MLLSAALLLGTWTATPDGQSTGSSTFKFDLQKQIIVRTNFAQYPESRHDDLMILYFEGKTPRAIYFDNEGHTIRYTLAFPARNQAVFESEPSQPGPRYRLTHAVSGKKLEGKFEIADPGTSTYKPYLTWTSTKSE
jgi:hypothetical protein